MLLYIFYLIFQCFYVIFISLLIKELFFNDGYLYYFDLTFGHLFIPSILGFPLITVLLLIINKYIMVKVMKSYPNIR